MKTLQLTFSLLMILLSTFASAQSFKVANQISTKTSYATFASLDGKWTNTNPKALPTLLISGNSTRIRAWGKCHPTNCDWGTTRLSKARAGYRAVFNSSIAVRTLILSVMPDGKLKVSATYNYKDSRPTKRFTYYFKQRNNVKKIDGNWVNLDPNSLPKLFVSANSTRIRAWGKCHPSNCDWGTVAMTKVGSGYRAIFNDAVARRVLILTPLSNGQLNVRATYNYKDSRPTKRLSYTFKKEAARTIDGIYSNANPNALPKLQIYGNSTKIKAWGKCTPNNCPWGSANLRKIGARYKAVFNDPVAVRTLIITPISGGRLKVQATYNYKDSRPTKRFNYSFRARRSS